MSNPKKIAREIERAERKGIKYNGKKKTNKKIEKREIDRIKKIR